MSITYHMYNDKWIVKECLGFFIRIRRYDGYFSADDICKVGGKSWDDNNKHDNMKYSMRRRIRILDTKEASKHPCHSYRSVLKSSWFKGDWVERKLALVLASLVSDELYADILNWTDSFMRSGVFLFEEMIEYHDARNNTTFGSSTELQDTPLRRKLLELQEVIDNSQCHKCQGVEEDTEDKEIVILESRCNLLKESVKHLEEKINNLNVANKVLQAERDVLKYALQNK